MHNQISLIFTLVLVIIFSTEIPTNLRENTNIPSETPNSETNISVSLLETDIQENKITSPFVYVNYIDNQTLDKIKVAYEEIDFEGTFNLGNTEKYDFYKKQFQKLLKGEVPVFDKEWNEEFYIDHYGSFISDVGNRTFDLNKHLYYFFDIDDDGTPELSILDDRNSIYVFKYNESAERFTVWAKYEASYMIVMGTKKMGHSGNGYQGFFLLDNEGENDCFVWSKIVGYWDSKNERDGLCFMVSIPHYANNDNNIGLTQSMKEQAYYDENDKRYYFRVTQEQYDELLVPLNKAIDSSELSRKKVTFTYDELFAV